MERFELLKLNEALQSIERYDLQTNLNLPKETVNGAVEITTWRREAKQSFIFLQGGNDQTSDSFNPKLRE